MGDGYIVALRVEREGCALAGRSDRVAAIDAELARCGVAAVVTPEIEFAVVTPEVETAVVKRGPGRPRKEH